MQTASTIKPKPDPTDSTLAAAVAAVLLLPAIYLAFWVVDDLAIYLRVALVIMLPSIAGSTVATLAQHAKNS